MTARDVLETNIDPAVPADMARRSIDDFAAEVLHEGAAVLEAIADEAEARVAAHYGLASGIGPGSADLVREDARTLRALAAERYGQAPANTAAGFFRPGRIYVNAGRTFKVVAIAEIPRGLRTALGFSSDSSGIWIPDGEYELDGWTDITEAGETPPSQHYDKVPDPADGCHWCACGNRWPCKDAPAVTA
ncbi:hypothetical protein [Streptomyces sp. NPDC020298]|uniref:hypothetical protein n=1 Tax=unclassified Streptomyces TaxID=2593676 RepID=UPI0033C20690